MSGGGPEPVKHEIEGASGGSGSSVQVHIRKGEMPIFDASEAGLRPWMFPSI